MQACASRMWVGSMGGSLRLRARLDVLQRRGRAAGLRTGPHVVQTWQRHEQRIPQLMIERLRGATHWPTMYSLGQGVPQDYAQAGMWYQKAADKGIAPGRPRKVATPQHAVVCRRRMNEAQFSDDVEVVVPW